MPGVLDELNCTAETTNHLGSLLKIQTGGSHPSPEFFNQSIFTGGEDQETLGTSSFQLGCKKLARASQMHKKS